MVQAVISSRDGSADPPMRPALQGSRMKMEGNRRAQIQGGAKQVSYGGRLGSENIQPNGIGGAANFEMNQNQGSMFQYQQTSTGGGEGTNKPDTGINLKMRQLYGLNPKVKPAILALNDSEVAYVCGHNTVIYNTENKSYRFIQGVEGTEGVTCMAVSDNKKFLAICERSQQAVCFVYEVASLKRRRIITSSESIAKEFIDVRFAHSEDKMTNFMLTLTGEPDYRLVVWLWDKQRFIAQLKFDQDVLHKGSIPMQACFNPHQQTDAQLHGALLVLGSNCYKYYKLNDTGNFSTVRSQLSKKDPEKYSQNYTSHAWVQDGLLVCTDRGEIMFCDQQCDFKFMLIDSPGGNFRIQNILMLKSEDFIIADGSGQFCYYEPTGELRNPYKLFKSNMPTMVDQEDSKWNKFLENQDSAPFFPITGMDQIGDHLIYTTSKRQILKMRIQKEKTEDFGKISYLTIPYHRHKINALATCMKQPILATASGDNTLMIWQYTAHPGSLTLQIVKQLPDIIQAIAIHPSGFYIVIGHLDRVSIYTLLPDDVPVAQFEYHTIRGCTEIQFANGGHMYATNDDDNNVQVFSFWENQRIINGVFKGHNSQVKSILWLEDDTGFITVGKDDKKVILWSLKPDEEGSHIVWQHTQQYSQFYDVQYTENDPFFNVPGYAIKSDNPKFNKEGNSRKDGKDDTKEVALNKLVVYSASRDGSIRELIHGKSRSKYETGFQYSQLRLMVGGKAFFAGIANPNLPGAIHVVNYPFADNQRMQEIQVHEAPVTKMVLNYEHTMLFSGSEDGSLAVMIIADRPKGTHKDVSFIKEVLVQGKLYRQLEEEIKLTQEELVERKRDSDDRIKGLRSTKEREIERLARELEYEEQKLNSELNGKQSEKDDMLRYQVEKRKEMEDLHARQLKQMKVEHDRKKGSDEEKFQGLLEQKQAACESFQETLERLSLEQCNLLEKMSQEHNEELYQARQKVTHLEEEDKAEDATMKNLREEAEAQAWKDYNDINDKNRDVLAVNIEKGLENKAEFTKFTRELTAQNLERSNKAKDLQEKKNQLENKMIEQQKIKADIAAYEEQFLARIATIDEKDIQIGQLQKKIQELEKFKFVLDYKIKELKRDICPKEVQIQKLNEQTNKMRSEQKHFDRVNQNLVLIVEDLRMRQEGLTKAASTMESKISRQDNTMKRFKDDVQQMLFKNNLSYKELKKGVVRLYRTWVLDERVKDTGTTDVYQIYNQQRNQIENNVRTLQRKLSKETTKHTQENARILKENVMLIKELNQLRAEEQKLKIGVRQVMNHTRATVTGGRPQTAVNVTNNSQQSFAQKRIRVQSAVNTRTRDINFAKREQEQLTGEARRYEVELNEIKQNNERIKLMIQQKQEQHHIDQFNQAEGQLEQPQFIMANPASKDDEGATSDQVAASRQPNDQITRPSEFEQDIDGVPVVVSRQNNFRPNQLVDEGQPGRENNLQLLQQEEEAEAVVDENDQVAEVSNDHEEAPSNMFHVAQEDDMDGNNMDEDDEAQEL